MKIGVVSDTHGYFDPRLPQLLAGVTEILHAGDVGPQQVLDQFSTIAPVEAVRGNIDAGSLGLSPTLTRRYRGVEIHMMHELPKSQSALRGWGRAAPLAGKQAERCNQFLRSFPEECRLVVFGHTNEPCLEVLAGKLFFNPGSAGRKRFSLPRCCGLLEISPAGVRATILSLERYNNEDLPGDVWLPLGGP
jgi:putative phosphoesterase